MDAHNIVTTFVATANQYVVNQSENNVKDLQRHLEVLVCLTSEESNLLYFQNRSPLSSQCITHVINVILDGNSKKSLISRAFTILHNLQINATLFKSLQSSFHVHSALSTFLQNYGVNVKDPLVLQCLNLLEDITYNIKIDYIENHFESLIDILLNIFDADSHQLTKISLHILSNVCRHNAKIQSYVCSLPNAKQIVKKLISILNTSEPSIILYALSILSSITPYNQVGAKLWTDEHLMMTFDLIIKLLFSDSDSCSATALDLFIDLILVPKYRVCFMKSPNLGRCLRKISKQLYNVPTKRAVLYLKFLFAAASTPDCLGKVCSVLCIPVQDSGNPQTVKIHPMLAKWCADKSEISALLPKISLQLVKTVLTLYTNGNFCLIEENIKEILKNILESMYAPKITDDFLWEEFLEFQLAVFEILLLLCKDTSVKDYISQYIDIKVCEENTCLILSKSTDGITCSELEIDLFLMILETIALLHPTTSGCDEALCRILGNSGAMQCISYALTSNNSARINRGLLLISQSHGKCSLDILSENLLARNTSLQKSMGHASDTGDFPSMSSDLLPSAPKKLHLNQSPFDERSVDVLLSRIENGLQIKDLKSSEIMDLYEHKIAMLTLKEQELQSYVDAKTAALQEADRIITQYKCRQVDADNEALRLRSMMKDYECRCEKSTSLYESAEQKLKKAETNFLESCHRIKELEQSLNEQRELMQTQMNRLFEQKRNVEEERAKLSNHVAVKEQEKKQLLLQLQQSEEELRLEKKALEELGHSRDELQKMLEETKKSAEKAKQNFEQQYEQMKKLLNTIQQTVASLEEKNENLANEIASKTDNFLRQLSDLKDEKDQLTEQLKLKDSKIEDLSESLRKLNDSLSSRTSALQEVEAKLKLTLEQTGAQKSKLQQDKKMLELLCKKYEASIEEKDSQIQTITSELEVVRKEYEEFVSDKDTEIKHLQEELQKHEYITGMIRNLTSGKLDPPPK